jgi:hypothetical protein
VAVKRVSAQGGKGICREPLAGQYIQFCKECSGCTCFDPESSTPSSSQLPLIPSYHPPTTCQHVDIKHVHVLADIGLPV